MLGSVRNFLVTLLGIALCLFVLVEANFPNMKQPADRAVFVMLGLVLCFLVFPAAARWKDKAWARALDVPLSIAAVVACSYVVVQTQPLFESFWAKGMALGDRAGAETGTDFVIGLVGLFVVLEATRRSIGWIVPLLALAFIAHSYYCHLSYQHGLPQMPSWMLPHAGQSLESIASTTFLQSLGVFGQAAYVMFKYVFLFVVFGAFLEMSGATQFIIDFAERVFGRSPGGPAKVSVLGSGLMGSLSGSAVANAVTTGAFTIPMMRNTGFQPHIAGGITAAAASGGALVPPVMGAGAYMMLELVEPKVTFLQIATAAAIPAVLYYFSIWMIVHFYSRRVGAATMGAAEKQAHPLWQFEGLVFFGALAVLVGLLVIGRTPFKAVSGALVLILVLSALRRKLQLPLTPRVLAVASFFVVMIVHQAVSLHLAEQLPRWMQVYLASPWENPNTGAIGGEQVFDSLLSSSIIAMLGLILFGLAHPAWRPAMLEALTKSAKNGIALVSASACVGIIIGIVQVTGIADDFGARIKDVVENSLFLALVGIMVCSIILGMGVPSVVCYLLMATLMGSLLSELGVIPLAAHLFIFYFGMMSMVTPPVALAAYASASIAEARIMPTAFASFRFALVGFTLPFMFIYRPELLLLTNKPDVTVSLARPKEIKAGQPGDVTATLIWAGTPLAGRNVEITPVGGSDPRTVATDFSGMLRVQLEPDRYELTTFNEAGKRLHLGIVDFDPARAARGSTSEESQTEDDRLQFFDQRLSIPAVVLAVAMATVGILALAAGIAGFLFSEIRVPVRIGMLAAAALLLSPDVRMAGHEIGMYTNIAGCGLFAVTAVINWTRSRRRVES